MKVNGKNGITLIALVITIVILGLMTITILDAVLGDEGIINETTNTVKEQERRTMIETITKDIQTERLKKESKGQYTFTVQEDIVPILQQYGDYNHSTLQLITTEDQYEIFLYEVMQIPLLEYVVIEYENEELTVNSNLMNVGYVIEYTLDGGQTWEKYTNTVNAEDNEKIYVRMTNGERKVISNTVKVKEGTMQSEDTQAPIIRVVPSTGTGRAMYVTIYVIEYGTLDANNVYEYYLSTDSTRQENGQWKTYIPNERFTLATSDEGNYYLHINTIKDSAGNVAPNKVVGPYKFTEDGVILGGDEESGTIPNVSLTINENLTVMETQTTTIQVDSDNVVLYSYGWSTSDIEEPENWSVGISKVQTVQISNAGTYYLWIKDLQDADGNKAPTINVNGMNVNLVSGPFVVD